MCNGIHAQTGDARGRWAGCKSTSGQPNWARLSSRASSSLQRAFSFLITGSRPIGCLFDITKPCGTPSSWLEFVGQCRTVRALLSQPSGMVQTKPSRQGGPPPPGFAAALIAALEEAQAAAAQPKPAAQLAKAAWDKLQFDFPVRRTEAPVACCRRRCRRPPPLLPACRCLPLPISLPPGP